MGHIRMGVLPRSRKWDQVVELLHGGSSLRGCCKRIRLGC